MKHIIDGKNILDKIDPSIFLPKNINEAIVYEINEYSGFKIDSTYHFEYVTVEINNEIVFKRDYFFTLEQIDESDIFGWLEEYLTENGIDLLDDYYSIIDVIDFDEKFKEYITMKYINNAIYELKRDIYELKRDIYE